MGHASSFDRIKELEDEGVIEVYDHQGEGHERSVRAVRLASSATQASRGVLNLGDLFREKLLGK